MDLLPFLPPDKAEHALSGAFLGAATVAIVQKVDPSASWLDRVAWGTAAGLAAGVAKEGLDRSVGSRFDPWDAAATTAGAFLGSALTASLSDALTVVITPSRDGGSLSCTWRI